MVRGFTMGQTVIKVASNKMAKHEKVLYDNQHIFIHFAFNTFDFLTSKAVDKMTIAIENSHINGGAGLQTLVTTFDLTISIFLSVELRFSNQYSLKLFCKNTIFSLL
jgi:hypothetical protein